MRSLRSAYFSTLALCTNRAETVTIPVTNSRITDALCTHFVYNPATYADKPSVFATSCAHAAYAVFHSLRDIFTSVKAHLSTFSTRPINNHVYRNYLEIEGVCS
jgi:hypothetical protein